jgi:hypothetical protein
MKSLWNRFIQLKTWQRVAILAGIGIIAIGSSGESSNQDQAAEETQTAEASASPTPEPSLTASESPSPTPSESPTPESPLEFRFSALRDLEDMRKDISDARAGISEEGLGKFFWNVVEIQFNMAQLEALLPREEYAEKWNAKLAILKEEVDSLDASDENLTISKAKSQLSAILSAIPALESIARSLAN